MKKVIIAAVILVATGIATICWGDNNPGNSSMDKCQDNVKVTVYGLGGLPQNGTIKIKFINSEFPEVSCTRDRTFTSTFDEQIWGNYNNESWSDVSITVILGNFEYIATYYSTEQWKPVVFTGADFHPTIQSADPYHSY